MFVVCVIRVDHHPGAHQEHGALLVGEAQVPADHAAAVAAHHLVVAGVEAPLRAEAQVDLPAVNQQSVPCTSIGAGLHAAG